MSTTTNSDSVISGVLAKAKKEALSSGLPGMAAMAIQVSSLMWLRTTVNYQYRYGSTMTTALQTLYGQGGIARFYKGYTFALIQAPLSRFGDTAANAGMLSVLNELPQTANWPLAVKTACASVTAGFMRIGLMPIDTVKTVLQVEGSNGWNVLRSKLAERGPSILFHGSIATSLATFVGHYPWFVTYNYLNRMLPVPASTDTKKILVRSAAIGFTASVVSDTVSNSIRVIKTTRQTSNASYSESILHVLEKDGWRGLFGRGLKTKIVTNGMQGLMFSVLWKVGQDIYSTK